MVTGTTKKKRLLLINPANPMRKGILPRTAVQPPISLAIVASLTPPDWEVRIIDENFRSHTFKEADLVGITALSSTSPRAYKIASEYREKGIPTVLGGVHATLMSDEALNYVDSVIIGHAEPTWPDLIRDVEKGELKKRYQGIADMKQKVPIPRYDLLHPGYVFGSVQTTRGCQMNCDFCTVPVVNNHRYQMRDVNTVLDELEAIPHKLIYVVDDNMVGSGTVAHEHAKAIFRGMIDRNLKKEWFAYAALNIGDDEEIVSLMAKSGCKMLLLGIESEKPDQLKNVNKKMNLAKGTESYRKVVRLLHKYGICVVGSFIFGMENDHQEDLRARMKFMLKYSFDIPQPNVMTPFPGTRLFERVSKENRLIYTNFPDDWKHYHGQKVVYKPDFIDPDVLSKEIDIIGRNIYRKEKVIFRFFRTWWNTRKLRSAIWAYSANMNYRKLSKDSLVLIND
jgi:radical SAM superfamily enzyme YgiQ (UPF0313 family)